MDPKDHDPRAATRTWVIVGCGYTGVHLAVRLVAAGESVIAVRRGERPAGLPAEAGFRRADLADPASLAGWIPAGAVVVHAAPPADEDPGAAERNLVAAAAGAARIVYVSSTGVYGPGDGGWVDEDTPVPPPRPSPRERGEGEPRAARGEGERRGDVRLVAETALLAAAAAAGIEAVALRASGIYGPGRGVAARLRAGTYRVVGGDTWVNRIHVHDLCSAILAAGTIAVLPRRIYTVADDEPTTARAHADAVAAALGLPPPPTVAPTDVDPRTAAMLGANRRIANRRLKEELGVTLRYPTWRESLAEELAATSPSTAG